MKKLFCLSLLLGCCVSFARAQGVTVTASALQRAIAAPSGACAMRGAVRIYNVTVYVCPTIGTATWTSLGGGGGTSGNPTASVGLAAVNGSASTFLRSDAAPALAQDIVPTWTGIHTWGDALARMTSPRITTGLKDANGNAILDFSATASAVNRLQVANAATGNAIAISTAGSDTNRSVAITPAGTGQILLPAGAVATPILANSANTNTGLRFLGGFMGWAAVIDGADGWYADYDGGNRGIGFSTNSGRLAWHSATSAAVNTHIRRAADGVVSVGGNANTDPGTLSSPAKAPSQITADQNNYTGCNTSFNCVITADAARAITGMTAGQDGERKTVCNSSANTVTLNHEDANSTAANRFSFEGAANLTIPQFACRALVYLATPARWYRSN